MLYLDTSALIKLYVDEQYSAEMFDLASESNILASHLIAFVELHAALSRLNREGKLSDADLVKVKDVFASDWPSYLKIGVDQALAARAADLAEALALRGYDSIHLAAAEFCARQSNEPVVFASFDAKLNRAAKVLGLVLPECCLAH